MKHYDILGPKRIKKYEDDMIWYQENLPEMTHEQTLEEFIISEIQMYIDEMVEEIN